jgi:hypothetical protein
MSTSQSKSLLLDNNKDTKSSRLIPSNLPDPTNDKALLALDGLQTPDPAYSIAKSFETENRLNRDNGILADESFQALGLVEVRDYAELARRALIPQGRTIDPPETVFQFMGVPIFTKKSISLLIAKAKAGKTTTAAWIIAQAIKEKKKVFWIDTEQGSYYASIIQSWILSIAGLSSSQYLRYYDVKLYNPQERIALIHELMMTEQPETLVIDGIRDLVSDINSPMESTTISTRLMQWADIGNCHIITILHQNKSNDEARGHLGTELVNKAETVIRIIKAKNDQIIVEQAFSRGPTFDTFALIREANGIPRLHNSWNSEASSKPAPKIEPEDILEELHVAVVNQVFEDNSNLSYNELGIRIQQVFSSKNISFGTNKSKEFIKYYIGTRMVLKNPFIKGNAKYESGLTQFN